MPLEESFFESTMSIKQNISDLVFKKRLFYGGFCFGGVAMKFDFKIEGFGRVQIPVADDQMEQLLRIAKPTLSSNHDGRFALDYLRQDIGYEIGCSMDHFKLKFKALYVETKHEVVRHNFHKDKKTQNQFGTVFIQPPAKYTGGEMKVYRKLNAEGDQKQEIRLDFGTDAESKASKWHFGFISADAEYEIAKITSGSRLVLVFAAIWITDLQPEFPEPEHIDQIAAQLKLLSAKGEFLASFIEEDIYYEKFGEQAIIKADQNLIRLLDAANNHLEKPFKVALVTIQRHFVLDSAYKKQGNNAEEIEALVAASNADTVDPDRRIKECKIEQEWFDLSGKPWSYQPKANLETMANILNPKKKSLEQLWGSYACQLVAGTPSQDNESKSKGTKEEEKEKDSYNCDATKTVTYEVTLLVLWSSELSIDPFHDLEAIFPKDSNESRWLMKCNDLYFDFKSNELEKANQLVEQLKVYERLFSVETFPSNDGKIQRVVCKKTEEFKRHQLFNDLNKTDLKDNADQEPPGKKLKIEH